MTAPGLLKRLHGIQRASRRVIIANHHGLFRQGLQQLLETEGYSVEAEATSGDEALAVAAAHQGCVLLLDIAMPGMDGLEVARRLGERGDDVKVVMLSAREDRDALFPRGGTVLSTGVAHNLGVGIRQLDYVPVRTSRAASRSSIVSSRSCAYWPHPSRRRRWPCSCS